MGKNGNRPRPDLKEMRRREAAERQEKYSKKSAAEIVAELDAKYGVGKGAKKVRAKLAKTATRAEPKERAHSVAKTDEAFKAFLATKKKK